MYVHIGSDRIVRLCDIVGIFDLDGEITTEPTAEQAALVLSLIHI